MTRRQWRLRHNTARRPLAVYGRWARAKKHASRNTHQGTRMMQNWKGVIMRLMLIAATLFSCSVTANEAPPGFDPASVPESLRLLEGRTAFIKIPSPGDAPL